MEGGEGMEREEGKIYGKENRNVGTGRKEREYDN